MGLLTHNMVSCSIKGVSNRYPMKLEVEKWVMKETKLNADFLYNIFPKIEWLALVAAAEAFGCPDLSTGLLDPTMLGSDEFLHNIFPKIEWLALVAAAKAFGCPDLSTGLLDLTTDEFLHKFHHALLELHVEEGAHVTLCPKTDRRFPINKGILNMLLHVDEV